MEHPNDKVARASHSVFMTFMTMGRDSEKNDEANDEASLKEQLVFHYMQRSLLVLYYAKKFSILNLRMIIWNSFYVIVLCEQNRDILVLLLLRVWLLEL